MPQPADTPQTFFHLAHYLHQTIMQDQSATLALLHRDRPASPFYRDWLEWRTQRIDTRWGTYHALPLGDGLDGGIVACGTRRAVWLPYIEVDQIAEMTEQARAFGASVLLGPREGPAGWRSVISTPAGGEIALWRPKR